MEVTICDFQFRKNGLVCHHENADNTRNDIRLVEALKDTYVVTSLIRWSQNATTLKNRSQIVTS